MDYKQILTDLARALVDTPDAVNVVETVEENDVKLLLTVAPDDTGMVIGRHGKIAKAIRSVMKVAGNREGKHVTVEIE
ncbi:MAG: KH domain-containing protein [Clostridia bacterium]|nr:KH domain-containing protein [Clostridia bacterium]